MTKGSREPGIRAGDRPGCLRILAGSVGWLFRRGTTSGRLVGEIDFLARDWIALALICLLAVAVRASVMALLPSILHPDEVMWLEQANRLVNHQGLVPWDFQLGERQSARGPD